MLLSIRCLLSIAGISCAMGMVVGPALAAEAQQHEADSAKTEYFAEDIKSTMLEYIRNTVNSDGVFHMQDDKTGELLSLKFVRIHDPVRQIGSDIYFACTDFHVVGEVDKLYDLDFWMNNKTGELRVYQSKVHKEPRKSLLYGWYKQPRYTFVNDEIKYLY